MPSSDKLSFLFLAIDSFIKDPEATEMGLLPCCLLQLTNNKKQLVNKNIFKVFIQIEFYQYLNRQRFEQILEF